MNKHLMMRLLAKVLCGAMLAFRRKAAGLRYGAAVAGVATFGPPHLSAQADRPVDLGQGHLRLPTWPGLTRTSTPPATTAKVVPLTGEVMWIRAAGRLVVDSEARTNGVLSSTS
jgi:hypothetical protein